MGLSRTGFVKPVWFPFFDGVATLVATREADVCIGFSGSFDTILHDTLMWVKLLYGAVNNHFQRVIITGLLSDWEEMPHEVTQGSALGCGSTLFNTFTHSRLWTSKYKPEGFNMNNPIDYKLVGPS